MRDAESMLDQLLSSSAETIDEGHVRDLLGLADADTIEAFVAALVAGDLVAGVGILDALEDRGRDLRAFLDQVIDAIRGAIVGAAGGTGAFAHGIAELVPVARRLAAIDPNRAGIGGLRLQLEIALFPVTATIVSDSVAARPAAPRIAVPERPARPPQPSVPLPTPTGTEPAPAAPAPDAAPRRDAEEAAEAPAVAEPRAPETLARARARGQRPRRPTRLRRPATPAREPSPPAPAPAGSASSAAPAPSETAPAVALDAPIGADLALLRERWPEVVARISAHPPTKPLISVCRPIAVEDGIVTLGFPEDQGFLRAVAERRRTVLEDGIGAVLGRPVGVRCVATNLDLVPPLPADADAAFVLAEARRIFEGDDADAAPVD